MKKILFLVICLLSATSVFSQTAKQYGTFVTQNIGTDFTIEKILSNTDDNYHAVMTCKYISEYALKGIIERKFVNRYSDLIVFQNWKREYSNNGDFIMLVLVTEDLKYVISFAYMVTENNIGLFQVIVQKADATEKF